MTRISLVSAELFGITSDGDTLVFDEICSLPVSPVLWSRDVSVGSLCKGCVKFPRFSILSSEACSEVRRRVDEDWLVLVSRVVVCEGNMMSLTNHQFPVRACGDSASYQMLTWLFQLGESVIHEK